MWIEITIGMAVLILGLILLNPMNIFMPDMVTMLLIGIFFALFAAFAVFIWRERALDEREELHRMLSGRIAYLAASAILVLGIGMQTFTHHVDPWLVAALAGAVLAKIAALHWNKNNN